jgi:hypothetical protein
MQTKIDGRRKKFFDLGQALYGKEVDFEPRDAKSVVPTR